MTTGAVGSGVVLAEIRDTPLSVDEVVEAVRHPGAGAVVTFIGYVREHDHGEPVDVLDYTRHPNAEQVAVTLEDAAGADAPTTTPLFAAPIRALAP